MRTASGGENELLDPSDYSLSVVFGALNDKLSGLVTISGIPKTFSYESVTYDTEVIQIITTENGGAFPFLFSVYDLNIKLDL